MDKVFLLKEILDRVEIPAWDVIPGKDEVAEKKIARWTLPGTEITIAQMEEGQRAGEFLVSAYTVQQLKNFYELGSSSWGRPD